MHHDLWDYDPPAAPILIDIVVDGRPIKAVVLLTKQSFAYVFDRVTGEPVWPIVERPVPQSNVPGERTSTTQPFPTKPPAFDLQGATEENLIDFTPELRAEALEIIKRYTTGPLFTPPSFRDDRPGGNLGTIQLPGSAGGANWTGGAFDPETHILYVPSATAPFVADIEPGDPARTNLRYVKGKRLGDRRAARAAAVQAAVRPHQRDRHEQRRDPLAGRERRRAARQPRDRAPESRQPRQPGPLGAAAHEDVAVRWGRLRRDGGRSRVPPDMPFDTAPNYGEPWFRALRQGDGRRARRDRTAGRHDRRSDDVPARGKQYIVVAVGGRDREPEWVALSL